MPALDLALGLRVVWPTPNMIHTPVFKPIGRIAGDIRRSVIAEQSRFGDEIGAVAWPLEDDHLYGWVAPWRDGRADGVGRGHAQKGLCADH